MRSPAPLSTLLRLVLPFLLGARSLLAAPVELSVDAATDGLATATQTLIVSGVIEIGWLDAGVTQAQIQALATAGDFAGIDAVFHQVATIPFPSAAIDFDSGGGQYFEVVTLVADGNAAALAAYKDAATGAAGKDMYSWVRNSVAVAGTTQMAFLDGVGVFPTANDNVNFTDFGQTFAHSVPPVGTVAWVGSFVPVTVGGAIDNSGAGNTAGDGLGATGSGTVLQLASVVTVTSASLQFSAGTAIVVENAVNATVTVTRTGKMDNAVSVQFATADASAIAGTDYTATSGTLSFAANESSRTITVPIANPAGFQGDRSFAITLSNPLPSGGAELGTPATIAVTIQDDETAMPGAIQLSAATYSRAENAGPVVITVRRVGGSDGAVSATLATVNGSATAPADFTAVSQTVSFPAGDAADRTIDIALNNDSTFEGDETFTVTLTGAAIGTPSTATVTIAEDDAPPSAGSLSFTSATYSGSEGAGTITIGVARTGGTSGAVTVQAATSDGTAVAPGDYTSTTAALSWTAGESGTKTFTVPVTNNTVDAADKTFNVALSNSGGGAAISAPASAVVTIADDDVAGTFAFSASTATVGENAGQVTLTIARTGGTAGAVDVVVNTAAGPAPVAPAADYVALTDQVVSFTNGQASKTVSVTINDNAAFTGSRNFDVVLATANNGGIIGANATATVTITDNDTPVAGRFNFLTSAYNATEGTPTVTLTVLRTDGSDGEAKVTYTAANGTAKSPGDFPATSGQITFAHRETSKTFTVPINDDTIAEAVESFTVKLSAPKGGAKLGTRITATVRIEDNEPTYRLDAATYSTTEGAALSIKVTRSNDLGTPRSVNWRAINGTAVAGRDFAGSGGTLLFDANVSEQTISIPILDDATPEGAETFRVSLVKADAADPTVGVSSPSTATVTIARSDATEQPDLSVSGGSGFVGAGILNSTGTLQSVIRTSDSATFTVRVKNVGNAPDNMVITGIAGGSATAGRVTVTRAGTDITEPVLSTTGYTLSNVPVNGTVELKVAVKVTSGRQFSGWGVTLTGASASTQSKADTVRMGAVRR